MFKGRIRSNGARSARYIEQRRVVRPERHRRQLALRGNLGLRRWWREIAVYRDDDKSGGSVITERLYIDVKQNL